MVATEVVPMEEKHDDHKKERSGQSSESESLYGMLKRMIVYYYARAEEDNDHIVSLKALLAQYRISGAREVLEQALAYAVRHLHQNGDIEAPLPLTSATLKALVDEKGPSVALEELMSRYSRFFLAIAHNVLYNYDLAQDGAMVAWERVYHWLVSLSRGRECDDPLPYLYKIVVNTCRTVRQREYREMEKSKKFIKDIEEQERRRIETPEDALVRRERERIVREVVDQLPPLPRQVIHLRYFFDEEVLNGSVEIEDERYGHIANMISRKESTLRSDVHRALMRMRKLLALRGIQR